MGCKQMGSYGHIQLSTEVISTLAGYTAMECYGVVGMASIRATDGLVELLMRENLSRGVRVEYQEGKLMIHLHIIVEYGVAISTVAENIIETVKYNVERLTGYQVARVDITVEGVRV